MGWETRAGGRRYLYRTVRRDGKVVREYVARDDELGQLIGALDESNRLARADTRDRERAVRKAKQRQSDELKTLADCPGVRDAAGALLAMLGFRRHNRGEWRMTGDLQKLQANAAAVKAELERRRPLVWFDATPSDAEAVALFKAARAGDAAAVAKLPAFLRDRDWVDWIGGIADQAGQQLIKRAAGEDPVFRVALQAKAADLVKELSGDAPTVLEKLLVRRVVNCWLFVHCAEIQMATERKPDERRELEDAVARGEKRMLSAVRELAVVRRLQAPALMARLEVVAGPRAAPPQIAGQAPRGIA